MLIFWTESIWQLLKEFQWARKLWGTIVYTEFRNTVFKLNRSLWSVPNAEPESNTDIRLLPFIQLPTTFPRSAKAQRVKKMDAICVGSSARRTWVWLPKIWKNLRAAVVISMPFAIRFSVYYWLARTWASNRLRLY